MVCDILVVLFLGSGYTFSFVECLLLCIQNCGGGKSEELGSREELKATFCFACRAQLHPLVVKKKKELCVCCMCV